MGSIMALTYLTTTCVSYLQGGQISVHYSNIKAVSGRLSCKVYMVNGVTLESNAYDVIDVREPTECEYSLRANSTSSIAHDAVMLDVQCSRLVSLLCIEKAPACLSLDLMRNGLQYKGKPIWTP